MKTLEEVRELANMGNAIPIYKELLADLETPITALLKLKVDAEEIFLLESVEGGEKIARYSFLGKTPLFTFKATGREVSIHGIKDSVKSGLPLEELKSFISQFKGVPDKNLPNFAGGGVGYIAYDAVRMVENIPDTGEDTFHIPDIHIGIYESFIVFDNVKHKIFLVSNVMPDIYGGVDNAYKVAVNNILRLEEELERPAPARQVPASLGLGREAVPGGESKAPLEFPWTSNVTEKAFEAGVEKCKEYILAGDAFQIVYSQRLSAPVVGDSVNIYRALRSINPSPYMYYLKFRDMEVIGSSPELLVRVNEGRVETRPIAGSRPRGATEKQDAELAEDLLRDEKERSEHVMLVDLGRNDVGRVSEYGSVKVTQFMEIEKYSHIMHIVSNVEGKLKPGYHCLDALMACFPAGTLSGAPKIRAMEIIDELEPHKRGIYGGAICYLDFNGNLDSCIAIRTMLLKEKTGYIQAGAGIVADSQPQKEYEETRNKAAALMHAVEFSSTIS